ncbi:unnamed protein product [Diatraea saccharalis]|uniref:Uncharacterized protein n=1 Tax=Diatraea saccharalis TaxID=40085 RepID=A0A9N9WCE8_9NEOP|nr:unnamed protein product [Diatraea saccharalis]
MAGAIKLLGGRGFSAASYMLNGRRSGISYFNYLFLPHLPRNSLIRIFSAFHSPTGTIEFRQLNPRRVDVPRLLQPNENNFDITNGFPKRFFLKRKDKIPKNQKRKVPKLILIQNPFTWLMIKIDFSVLRNVWDPTFEENEFKFGSKQVTTYKRGIH